MAKKNKVNKDDILHNNSSFTGNLCSDPEKKKTRNDKKYLKFRVAINVRKDSQSKMDAPTFFNCRMWQGKMETKDFKKIAKRLKKGSWVNVSGSFSTIKFQDDDDKDVFYTFLTVFNLIFLKDVYRSKDSE